MASSKSKALIWLIIAGVFGWTLYIITGKDFSKMTNAIKSSVTPK